MKRKMVIIGIGYVLGLFFASFFVPSRFWLVYGTAAMFLLFVCLLKRIDWKCAVMVFAALVFGTGIYTCYAAATQQPIQALAGKQASFFGQVVSTQLYDQDYAVYVLEGAFETGIRANLLCTTQDLDVSYGDYVGVSGTYALPEDDFLYRSALYHQGKSIFLKTTYDCTYTVIHAERHTLLRQLQAYREDIRHRLFVVSGRDGGALASGMLFGDRSYMADRTVRLFRTNGLAPMLSVSGFHLVLLLSVTDVFGRKTRLQRMLRFSADVGLLVLFTLITNWPVSVIRAGIMVLLSRSACIFFRKADALNSLCIAVLVMTIAEPFLIHDVSFLLSAAGTFGIGVLSPYLLKGIQRNGWYMPILRMFVSVGCASLCTIPICALYFSEASLLSPLTSFLFLPLCILILIPAMLVFLTGGAGWVAVPCGYVIKTSSALLQGGLAWFSRHLSWYLPLGGGYLPRLFLLLLLLIALTHLFLRSRRALCILLVFSVILTASNAYYYRWQMQQKLCLYVLGRQTAQVIVLTDGIRTDIIDLTGHYRNPDYAAELLSRRGIDTIQTLYVSEHADAIAAAYQAAFPERVHIEQLLAGGGSIQEDAEFCGIPVCAVPAGYGLENSVYQLSVRDGGITLSAYGRTIRVVPESLSEVSRWMDAETLVVCTDRKEKSIATGRNEQTGWLLAHGEALVLELSGDGTYRARRLG